MGVSRPYQAVECCSMHGDMRVSIWWLANWWQRFLHLVGVVCRPRLLIRDPGSSSVDSGPRVWIEATGSSDRHDIVARTLFL